MIISLFINLVIETNNYDFIQLWKLLDVLRKILFTLK